MLFLCNGKGFGIGALSADVTTGLDAGSSMEEELVMGCGVGLWLPDTTLGT